MKRHDIGKKRVQHNIDDLFPDIPTDSDRWNLHKYTHAHTRTRTHTHTHKYTHLLENFLIIFNKFLMILVLKMERMILKNNKHNILK